MTTTSEYIMASTVCVKELIHLFQIGMLENSKRGKLRC